MISHISNETSKPRRGQIHSPPEILNQNTSCDENIVQSKRKHYSDHLHNEIINQDLKQENIEMTHKSI